MLWRRKPNRDAGTPASASHRPATTAATLTRGHLNDLTIGLGQQMFFWGRDVLTDGNLLLRHGFQKHRSEGLQGTSCYCKPWEDGIIELHGACAGWYPSQGGKCGFLFIRNTRRCYMHQETCPVIPGHYDFSRLRTHDMSGLVMAGKVFAAWVSEYERWVFDLKGGGYREACFEMFRRLPASRAWLRPEAARSWISAFAHGAPGLRRSRHYERDHRLFHA